MMTGRLADRANKQAKDRGGAAADTRQASIIDNNGFPSSSGLILNPPAVYAAFPKQDASIHRRDRGFSRPRLSEPHETKAGRQ